LPLTIRYQETEVVFFHNSKKLKERKGSCQEFGFSRQDVKNLRWAAIQTFTVQSAKDIWAVNLGPG